nr:DEAD/DEAH box helicase [Rhodobacter amnigenus]
MNASPRYYSNWQQAVQRTRDEQGGLLHLSNWQVYSARLVSTTISSVALGPYRGAFYISMPTGAGKTTGAIWGMVYVLTENPDERICFLTPYQEAVDRVYGDLVARLGADVVGRYHSAAEVNKEAELAKQVVILTHQFVQANKGRLDDRTLFIVDEAVFSTGEASLTLKDFAAARDWATTNNVLSGEFVKLYSFVNGLDQQVHGGGPKYVAMPSDADLSFASTIAEELHLPSHSQTIDNMEVMSAVQLFCQALLNGTAFLSRGDKFNNGYTPTFYAAVLGIPNLEKTVVLTATGRLTYDVAGRFTLTSSAGYFVQPNYKNLRLVNLTGPKFNGHYKTWGQAQIKDDVVTYVDWVIQSVAEEKVYLTVPKQVLDRCLMGYFADPSGGKQELPFMVERHGKQIWVSHHSLSIGSNDYKDCDAVIYLFDDHRPQEVCIQRYHTLTGEPITDEVLEAVKGKLTGAYKKIKDATYLENMMQQIGRGRMRTYSEEVANPMTAYVFSQRAGLFDKLADQYPDCKRDELLYQGIAALAPKGRVNRILQYLRQHGAGRDVPADEVERAVGFPLRRVGSALEDNHDLRTLGYVYKKGGKGRGNMGMFRKVGEPTKP